MGEMADLTDDGDVAENPGVGTDPEEDDYSISSDSSDDAPLDLNGLKDYFDDLLENPKFFSGRIGCSEVIPDPINPGLDIEELGTIGLPLSTHEADRLIKAAASHTENDPGSEPAMEAASVWEISADRFKLRNPSWQKFTEIAVTKASTHMGFQHKRGDLTARPMKLIIQSTSGSEASEALSMYTDDPLQIAVLAFCLPSSSIGGDIILSANGEKERHSTSQSSEFDCSIFSWLSDVSVKLKPLTLGYRLILVYSINQIKGEKIISASMIYDAQQAFLEILDWWRISNDASQHEVPGVLVWIIEADKDHQESISISSLKDRDRQMVTALEGICSQVGVHVYLANVTKTIEGEGECCEDRRWENAPYWAYGYGDRPSDDSENPDEDEDEDTEMKCATDMLFTLDKVVRADGTTVRSDENIDIKNMIQFDHEDEKYFPYEKDFPTHIFPDKANIEERNGDTVYHHFHGVALVMVLPRDYASFILKDLDLPGTHTEGTIKAAIASCKSPVKNPFAKQDLHQLCQHIIKSSRTVKSGQTMSFPKYIFDLAVRGSILAGIIDLDFNISLLSESTFKDIGALIKENGFWSLEKMLTSGISKIPELSLRCSVFDKIETGVSEFLEKDSTHCVNRLLIDRWVFNQTESALTSCRLKNREDAHTLTSLSAKYGSQFLVTRILAAVKRSVKSEALVHEFLELMFHASQSDTASDPAFKAAALCCFRDVLSDLIPHLTFGTDAEGNKRQKTYPYTYSVAKPVEFSFQRVANLIDHCFSSGLNEDLETLINHLLQQIDSLIGPKSGETCVILSIFDSSVIPLLDSLHFIFTSVRSKNNRFEQPAVQKLFMTILNSYINLHINPVPAKEPPPQDWKKPRKGCGCKDCKIMDMFLENPHRQEAVFQTNKPHLKQRLYTFDRFGDRHAEHYIFEDLKFMRPHGLRIKKTHSAWEARNNYKGYRKSCENAATTVRRLTKMPEGIKGMFGLLDKKSLVRLDQIRLLGK